MLNDKLNHLKKQNHSENILFFYKWFTLVSDGFDGLYRVLTNRLIPKPNKRIVHVNIITSVLDCTNETLGSHWVRCTVPPPQTRNPNENVFNNNIDIKWFCIAAARHPATVIRCSSTQYFYYHLFAKKKLDILQQKLFKLFILISVKHHHVYVKILLLFNSNVKHQIFPEY